MRRAIILILIGLMTRTLMSCCKSDDYNVRWGNMLVYNLNTAFVPPVPLAESSIAIEKYGFRLNFEWERVAYNGFGNFAINEASAFKCQRIHYNKDTVETIDVITRFDFDSLHLQGSAINEYLLAKENCSLCPYEPISKLKDLLNEDHYDFEFNRPIDVKFTTVSPIPGPQRFIINVVFKSGRVFSDSTSIIIN